jgi:hypothetical protein
MSKLAGFILLCSIISCDGTGGPGGIGSCDVNKYPDDCSANEACNAATQKCETATSCTSNANCGGYLCTISSVCRKNCRGQTGANNGDCDTGYRCNATTFACEKVTTCNPSETDPCNGLMCDAASKTCKNGAACTDDTPCGNFTCTASGFCNISCSGAQQCKVGTTCNTTSATCQ